MEGVVEFFKGTKMEEREWGSQSYFSLSSCLFHVFMYIFYLFYHHSPSIWKALLSAGFSVKACLDLSN